MLAAIQAWLAAAATAFDLPILDWIRATLTSPVMDKAMTIVTMFGEGGVFWIIIALLLLISPRTRKTGWSMGAALILGVLVCNVTMKPIIARIRPYDLHAQLTGEVIPLLVKTPHDWSFPSGHTIASFEACVVLLIKNKWMGVPATILAIAVAFSRLYLYVHYPTDVLFSVIAGTLFAFLGVLIVNLVYKRFPPKVGKYQRV